MSLRAYPSQGLKCAGGSAAGRAVPNLSRDCGKRRGTARGSGRAQSPPCEPGRAAAGDLTPAQSRPVTSFFVLFCFGFGFWFVLGDFFGSNYFVAFKNSTVTTFFYD